MSDDRETTPDAASGPAAPQHRTSTETGVAAVPGPEAAQGSPLADPSAGPSASDAAAGPADPTVEHPADAAADPADGSTAAPADGATADAGDGSTADPAAVPDPGTAIPPGETRGQRRRREKAARPRRKAPWWELPLLVLLAIGIAILVKSFVVQPFYIPSESMEKTLHGCAGCSGDRILVNKPIYSVLRDPEPGDIVVFDAPPGWDDGIQDAPPSNPIVKAVRGFGQLVGFVPPDGEVLVKRVIAVGGQTVKGDAQGHVMISTTGAGGPYRTLDEPYVYSQGPGPGEFGPVTVPKGRLWVMGDHRDNSADSRYHCTPGGLEGTANDKNCDPTSSTVPVDKVIGKAVVIAWPPSRWRTLGTPSTFEGAAAAAGPALPGAVSLATVVPVFLVRRRRRRAR